MLKHIMVVPALLALLLALVPGGAPCTRRVCYFTNWSQYRDEPIKYQATDVDPYMCTHINYAFAKIEANQIAPYEWNDESTSSSKGQYAQITGLKAKNPNLKVLLSLGGWTLGSTPFHAVVETDATRSQFVSSTVQYLRNHNFDGLDVDWEYPANRGSPPEDRHKFSLLLQELKQAFEQESSGANRLLLTAAISTGKSTIDTAYEVSDICKTLDFVNLMTYDFHGSWDTSVGHNSPLYADSSETGYQAYLNVDWVVNYFIQQGCAADKLVVGMPLYARTFTLSSSDTSIGAPGTPGTAGPYTKDAGSLTYFEVCEVMSKNGLQRQLLGDQHVPYVVNGNQWIGYDDEESLREKVRYVHDHGLGGTMVWSIDQDDFTGTFCGKGQNPLLNAILDECSK